MAHAKKFIDWLRAVQLDDLAELSKNEFRAEDAIGGWAALPLMKILNFAVGECMEPDEIYLEIGTYAGRSLIGALKNNAARAQAIDNFWDNDQLKPAFEANIKSFGVADRVSLYNGNAEDFDLLIPRVGVYLYDANHDRGYTHFNLEKFKHYLSDEAIIIVDDIKIPAGQGHTCKAGYQMVTNMPVADDLQQWLQENHTNIEPICMTPWTYGQAIMRWHH
jgi:predicted O-methyltransferase YrrM